MKSKPSPVIEEEDDEDPAYGGTDTSSDEEEDEDEDGDQLLCSTCETHYEKRVAQCTECGAWSTIKKHSEIVAELADDEDEDDGKDNDEDEDDDDSPGPLPIDQIPVDEKDRLPTGISELDRVLGGGAVLGGVTLIGGDPGVGKSTLLMQALIGLSGQGTRCLYVSGEEMASQVSLRAMRIAENCPGGMIPKNLLLHAETRTEKILKGILQARPEVMVIDSVQTIRTKTDGNAGELAQLLSATGLMIAIAQKYKIATFLVGHITKDRDLAGPKKLEHLVDTVLIFEGEKRQRFRTLRAQKNRYGSSTEVGIFEMTATGMQAVKNASEFFLAERNLTATGSIIAATNEGTQPMLVEVQALVSNVKITGGRTSSNGVDGSRLTTILAVLEKILVKKGFELFGRDVIVNVAGGIKITEPALDLPIALAIVSSLTGAIIPPDVVAFGEVGLTGEIRSVPDAANRIAEATTVGFKHAILPKNTDLSAKGKKSKTQHELRLMPVRTLEEAISFLPAPPSRPAKEAKSNGGVPRSARP